MSSSVFVTVGSTSFDELIHTVCLPETLQALVSKGFKHLTLQIGNGSYIPKESSIINLEWYRYKEIIVDDIKASSLVISHAGAGSIIETLKQQRALIVVINEHLMENHQYELARQLASDEYLKFCVCRNLTNVLAEFKENELRKYLPADPQKFSNYLDSVLGYK